MKKLLTYIIVFVIVGTGIISCNTDIEALDIVVPDKMSKEYWENLRAYKARNDHEVFFGWFGGWTANSADMINYLRSVPDSVDIISIWGAYQNLSPAQMDRVGEWKESPERFPNTLKADRKSTRLNSSHGYRSRMPSSA